MTEQMVLFVNACIRKNSRTRFLAEQVIRRLNGVVVEVNPATATKPITSEKFIINRTEATGRMDFSDPAYAPARQFANVLIVLSFIVLLFFEVVMFCCYLLFLCASLYAA